MNALIWPALLAAAATAFGAVLVFIGVFVRGAADRKIAAQATEAKREEIAVSAERVDVDHAKVAIEGLEHLVNLYKAECDRKATAIEEMTLAHARDRADWATRAHEKDRQHEAEYAPLKRYVEALQKETREGRFLSDLEEQLYRKTVLEGQALVAERRKVEHERELLAEIRGRATVDLVAEVVRLTEILRRHGIVDVEPRRLSSGD